MLPHNGYYRKKQETVNKLFFFFYLLLSFVQSSNAQQGGDTLRSPDGSFRNPVFGHNFPDPNLVKAADGYFYAYATQTTWQKGETESRYVIPILRSNNLVHWEVVGDALQRKPSWKTEGGIWAPDAAYYKGRYYLYYSFSTWGDPNPGIGVATAANPQGPFADHGKLFFSKEIGVDNSIDAFFFQKGQKPYLVWGSFHGIYAVRLSKDGLKIKGKKMQLAGNAYEGSLIYKKDGYYYYFGSVGSCCEGAKSTYRVKVGRSRRFKGPYVDRDGKPLLQNGGTLLLQRNGSDRGFVGPGHNGDIVTDKRGDTWMLYHAFDNQNPKSGRLMLLDKIIWKEGWPYIEGAEPSLEPQAAPLF